jgi:hypothetical protein
MDLTWQRFLFSFGEVDFWLRFGELESCKKTQEWKKERAKNVGHEVFQVS